jgi:hypothetical protein
MHALIVTVRGIFMPEVGPPDAVRIGAELLPVTQISATTLHVQLRAGALPAIGDSAAVAVRMHGGAWYPALPPLIVVGAPRAACPRWNRSLTACGVQRHYRKHCG